MVKPQGRLIVYIAVSDRDYHGAYVDTIKMPFDSIKEAEEWCRINSKNGIDYDVDVKLTKAVNAK